MTCLESFTLSKACRPVTATPEGGHPLQPHCRTGHACAHFLERVGYCTPRAGVVYAGSSGAAYAHGRTHGAQLGPLPLPRPCAARAREAPRPVPLLAKLHAGGKALCLPPSLLPPPRASWSSLSGPLPEHGGSSQASLPRACASVSSSVEWEPTKAQASGGRCNPSALAKALLASPGSDPVLTFAGQRGPRTPV